MANVSGIQIEKDSKGRPAYARISLKKYGKELAPFLDGIGVFIEDDFEEEWSKGGLTVEEARKQSKSRIKQWPWEEAK